MFARSVALAAVLLSLSCIPKVPRQRLETTTPILVGYVVDPTYAGDATTAPDALKEAIAKELESRNLGAVEVPFEALKDGRLTDTRKVALQAHQSDAPYFLLVELRVHFFSQLDGRYRWEVGTALTAIKNGGPETRDAFEMPVILQYDHEKQSAAINAAASDIATRLGVLVDGLIQAGAAPTPVKASRAPTPAKQPAPKTAARTPPKAIYFVMVDRFANGDRSNDGDSDPKDPQGFHGGDLKGLLSKLDTLKELGVDTVWLSPVFGMRTTKWHGYGAFHGYWSWDLSTIEPRFGDEALLARLSDELHARDMKLVLDLVLNHVGPDAPLVTQKPEWFHHHGGVTDWNDPVQLTTYDVHGLPDFATEREDVAQYLLENSRRWLRARST
jgi:hypothetical protein